MPGPPSANDRGAYCRNFVSGTLVACSEGLDGSSSSASHLVGHVKKEEMNALKGCGMMQIGPGGRGFKVAKLCVLCWIRCNL